MSEKEIEMMMRKEIGQQEGKFLKLVSPGNDGVPDRIAIFPGGEIWFVELKTKDGHVKPIQTKWQNILSRLGCRARIIKGEDQAREWLDKHREWFYGV